jgi:hypothetical protein
MSSGIAIYEINFAKTESKDTRKRDKAIKFALENVPSEHILHWFQHCGYDVSL